jgi:hypothetical protein
VAEITGMGDFIRMAENLVKSGKVYTEEERNLSLINLLPIQRHRLNTPTVNASPMSLKLHRPPTAKRTLIQARKRPQPGRGRSLF